MELVSLVAERLLLEHGFGPESILQILGGGDGSVWALVGEEVKGLSPAELGIIAATGKGSKDSADEVTLYEVHCGTYLGKYDSGIQILFDLAATAVVARMAEIVRRQVPVA